MSFTQLGLRGYLMLFIVCSAVSVVPLSNANTLSSSGLTISSSTDSVSMYEQSGKTNVVFTISSDSVNYNDVSSLILTSEQHIEGLNITGSTCDTTITANSSCNVNVEVDASMMHYTEDFTFNLQVSGTDTTGVSHDYLSDPVHVVVYIP